MRHNQYRKRNIIDVVNESLNKSTLEKIKSFNKELATYEYIVVQPEEGDLGVADNIIYQYTNGQWVDTGDTLERGFEDELRQNIQG